MPRKCEIEGCESNVFGKNRCKYHYPRTAIKKVSERGLVKKEEKKDYTKVQFLLFTKIWKEREHKCMSCGKWLGDEIRSIYFDHLLEKSVREDLALEEGNILVVCGDCHSCKTAGNPTAKHLKYINEAKEKYAV